MATLEEYYKKWLSEYSPVFKTMGTKYEAYIKAILTSIKNNADACQSIVNNTTVLNADEATIKQLEDFLMMPNDVTLSLDLRKARILLRTAGNPPTISNILNNIKKITNTENVALHEKGNPSDIYYDPSDPFGVKIIVTISLAEILEGFTTYNAEALIKPLFPSHTTTIEYDWTLPVEFQINYSPVTTGRTGYYDDYSSIYA